MVCVSGVPPECHTGRACPVKPAVWGLAQPLWVFAPTVGSEDEHLVFLQFADGRSDGGPHAGLFHAPPGRW